MLNANEGAKVIDEVVLDVSMNCKINEFDEVSSIDNPLSIDVLMIYPGLLIRQNISRLKTGLNIKGLTDSSSLKYFPRLYENFAGSEGLSRANICETSETLSLKS